MIQLLIEFRYVNHREATATILFFIRATAGGHTGATVDRGHKDNFFETKSLSTSLKNEKRPFSNMPWISE